MNLTDKDKIIVEVLRKMGRKKFLSLAAKGVCDYLEEDTCHQHEVPCVWCPLNLSAIPTENESKKLSLVLREAFRED